jgi:hypothetical protein
MIDHRRKLQVSFVMLLATLASSSMLVASASATPTGEQWLYNGEEVTSSLNIEVSTELLLEDTDAGGIKTATQCSMILKGSVKGAEGEISEILNLAKEAISLTPLSGTSLSCTNKENCESSKVWAVDLSWPIAPGAVEASEKELFIFTALEGSKGSPGWYVECTVLGIKSSDECTYEDLEAEAKNVTGGIEATFSKAQEEELLVPLGTCSISKGETGVVEGSGTIKATEGGTLSVSQPGGPQIEITPKLVNFGIVAPETTVEQEVLFENLGLGSWIPEPPTIDLSPRVFLFSPTSNTCATVVTETKSCLIRLQFRSLSPNTGYWGIFAYGPIEVELLGRTN